VGACCDANVRADNSSFTLKGASPYVYSSSKAGSSLSSGTTSTFIERIGGSEMLIDLGKYKAVKNSDRSIYQGETGKDGQKDGFGRFVWADGSEYIGYWKNNKANGVGRLTQPDGDTIEATWIDNKATETIIIKNDGARASRFSPGAGNEANTNEDLLDYGFERANDGTSYIGQYREGMREGTGKIISADGSIFRGAFHSGKINGFGVLKCFDGSHYEGEWRDNQKSGNGLLVNRMGDVYEGGFFDDHREGFGVQRNMDRSEYRGDWLRGKKHGYGTLTMGDGTMKQGYWDKDAFIGEERTSIYHSYNLSSDPAGRSGLKC